MIAFSREHVELRRLRLAVIGLVGRVNADPWRGFARGELLCGPQKFGSLDGPVDVLIDLSARPNEAGLTFGNVQGVAKEGWQFLWMQQGNLEQVLVEAPYPYGDLRVLDVLQTWGPSCPPKLRLKFRLRNCADRGLFVYGYGYKFPPWFIEGGGYAEIPARLFWRGAWLT